jgi:hypothetical protein
VTRLIRISPPSLNNWDHEKLGELGTFGRNWIGVFAGFLERAVQRRGVRVSTLKIGSRDGVYCFGGIQRFYAELRREYYGGNLSLVFLRNLLVSPRGTSEEGGHYVCFMRAFGGIWGNSLVV